MSRTCLYRHFDKSGRLLYVGISYDVLRRYSGHRTGSCWADSVVRIDVEHFHTRAEAEHAEALAIKTERPIHNVMKPLPASSYVPGEPHLMRFTEQTPARFPSGTLARIAAVAGKNQASAFIREAVEAEIARREGKAP